MPSKTVTADPTMEFVTLKLKGHSYKLIYSFNALAEAESLTGLNMFQGLDLNAITAQQLRAMLWAALSVAHPQMTIEDAGNLLTGPIECAKALKAVSDAWMASMPTPEPEDPNA